jgi:hypothetical protein
MRMHLLSPLSKIPLTRDFTALGLHRYIVPAGYGTSLRREPHRETVPTGKQYWCSKTDCAHETVGWCVRPLTSPLTVGS